MTDASFGAFASTTMNTTRSPAKASGKVGARTAVLTNQACTVPMPVDANLISLYSIQSPRKTYVVYVEGETIDIKKGDKVTISSTGYTVKEVQVWPDSTLEYGFLELILEYTPPSS